MEKTNRQSTGTCAGSREAALRSLLRGAGAGIFRDLLGRVMQDYLEPRLRSITEQAGPVIVEPHTWGFQR
jgi:hypothetical protein